MESDAVKLIEALDARPHVEQLDALRQKYLAGIAAGEALFHPKETQSNGSENRPPGHGAHPE